LAAATRTEAKGAGEAVVLRTGAGASRGGKNGAAVAGEGEDRDGFGVVTPRRWSGCYHAYGALNEREER